MPNSPRCPATQTCMTNSINGACARVFDEPRSHFQHKFCAICKERGVRVDAARVRMVKAEYQHEVGRMTRHAFGCANDKEPNDVFYYAATAALAGRGDVSARLVNNVAHSRGPAFIIFKDAAQVPDPLPAALAPLPEGLTERQQRVGSGMEEETINLIVKMGTLVPEKMTAMHEEAICTTTTHTTTPSPHRAVAVASMSTSSTAGAWKRRRASMEEEDDDDVHALFHFARQGVNRERQ